MNRKANIELLRLFGMVLIVAFHYQIHIAQDAAMLADFSYKQLILILFGSYGVYGSNVFFAISAYFLLGKVDIPYQKLLLINIKIGLIGTGLYFIAVFITSVTFSFKDVVKTLLPAFTYQYWPISAWLIITLIFPLLNTLVEIMEKKYYIFLLSILFYFFYIYACVAGFDLAGRLAGVIWIYLVVGFLEKKCTIKCKTGGGASWTLYHDGSKHRV